MSFSVLRATAIVTTLVVATGAQVSSPATQSGPTTRASRNPHGPLTVACENCHTADRWRPLRVPLLFNHDHQTGFPLRQGHRRVDCTGCHRDLRFAHVATACADCHRDPHGGEMGPACERCHTTAGWDNRRGVARIHAATLFPLTGAHVTVECSSCHRDAPNRYYGAPTRCFACHEDDFRRAIPSHAGFPKDCQTCHRTTTFSGANFPDHDRFFPITSGPHAGVWSSCSDCHISPGSFQVFSCINCHEHNRNEMDDEHDDVGGYRYESNACLSCHPTGRERG